MYIYTSPLQLSSCKPTWILSLTSSSLPSISHFLSLDFSAKMVVGIRVVDLGKQGAGEEMARACEEMGFFKVVNHGVEKGLMERLEREAVDFFAKSLEEKEMAAGLADPFGYGNKKIGRWGDMGWIEYLLFQLRGGVAEGQPFDLLQKSGARGLCAAVAEYTAEARRLAVALLEEMGKAMGLSPANALSRMAADEESDSVFRLNHYPPWPGAGSVTGFGAHTDPQLLSILRSNDISGLQISLHDGTWISVPPDHSSLFVNVGDSLQVLTNGRFKSVKHRVMVGEGTISSRVSMIFFAAPPPRSLLAPIPLLVAGGQEKLYREHTWSEYKSSVLHGRLSDDRILFFRS